MDKPAKCLLPSPNFDKSIKLSSKPKHLYLTPSGMTLLPREKQPPPMYGPRGTTVPAKFLNSETPAKQQNDLQYCEACEMELQSMEDLNRHRAQHQRCPVAGCNYRGLASVMDKHVASLHATGLFDKCKKLSSPEEIAAWREERRKRFPTVANVQMRQRAQEQRQKRGERLEGNNSRFGKREDRARIQRGGRAEYKKEREAPKTPEETNRNIKNIQRNNRRKKAKNAGAASKSESKQYVKARAEPETLVPSEEERCGVRMFKGTSMLEDYKRLKAKKAVEMKNALTGLLGMYGSDDNSEIEDDEDTVMQEPDSQIDVSIQKINNELDILEECSQLKNQKIKKTSATPLMKEDAVGDSSELVKSKPETIVKKTIEDQAFSDEAPDEEPILKSSEVPAPLPRHGPPRKQLETVPQRPSARKRTQEYGLDYRKLRLRKQNTMLEKLLEPDIRHERNVLLQCVRFVCENNYFDVRHKNVNSGTP